MAPAGLFSSNSPRLKSFIEEGDGDNCKQVESFLGVAVGSEMIINGVKHVVKQTVFAAARSLWIVTACLLLTSDSPDYQRRCDDGVAACVANPWKNGVRLDCQSCYQQCLHNRVWKCPVYE